MIWGIVGVSDKQKLLILDHKETIMGQRASIAHIKKNGKTRITSVQWSRFLDKTIGHYLNEADKTDHDLTGAAQKFFSQVTAYDHISSVEVDDESDTENQSTREHKLIEHGVLIDGIQNVNDNRYAKERDVPGGVYEYELNSGSIGAVYRENEPDIIELFYYHDKTGYLTIDKVSLFDLMMKADNNS